MRKLWNEGWQFTVLPLGSAYADMKEAAMQPVILPHDWLIADTDALYADGDGWYVNTLKNENLDACTLVDFDGV